MIDIGGYGSRQTRAGLALLDWQLCEEGAAVHSCPCSTPHQPGSLKYMCHLMKNACPPPPPLSGDWHVWLDPDRHGNVMYEDLRVFTGT